MNDEQCETDVSNTQVSPSTEQEGSLDQGNNSPADQGNGSPAQKTDPTFQHYLTFRSAPKLVRRQEPHTGPPKGWITSPRSHNHGLNTENTPQAQDIQKGANPPKTAGNLRKMSTPNLGDRRGEGSKAMDTLRRGLAYYTNQETRVESLEKPNGSPEAKTVT